MSAIVLLEAHGGCWALALEQEKPGAKMVATISRLRTGPALKSCPPFSLLPEHTQLSHGCLGPWDPVFPTVALAPLWMGGFSGGNNVPQEI